MSISTIHDRSSSANYFQFSESPVAYTCEVSDGVIADFDSTGGLRGIEVTDPGVLSKTPLEKLVHEANRASLGPQGKRKAVIPEL